MLFKSGMSMVTLSLVLECAILLTRKQISRNGLLPLSARASTPLTAQIGHLRPFQSQLLSTETRAAIDKAVGSNPVVLFMKGTPDLPQCGFSRASIQILGLQGVDPSKFSAFNVLEDEELRQGMMFSQRLCEVEK